MIRVLEQGRPYTGEIAWANDRMRWVDVASPTPDERQMLRAKLGLDPESDGPVASLDRERFGALRRMDRTVDVNEVRLYTKQNTMVTVRQEHVPALEWVWDDLQEGRVSMADVTSVSKSLLEALAREAMTIVDDLVRRAEEVEELAHKGARETGDRVQRLARVGAQTRRLAADERANAERMSRGRRGLGEPQLWADVELRLGELREVIGDVREVYAAALSHRTNDVINRLTILSTVFLPITFITGFFGQNFEQMPFDHDALMWGMLASCVVIPAGMIAWFRRSGWM